jgi:hypothetical protein
VGGASQAGKELEAFSRLTDVEAKRVEEQSKKVLPPPAKKSRIEDALALKRAKAESDAEVRACGRGGGGGGEIHAARGGRSQCTSSTAPA